MLCQQNLFRGVFARVAKFSFLRWKQSKFFFFASHKLYRFLRIHLSWNLKGFFFKIITVFLSGLCHFYIVLEEWNLKLRRTAQKNYSINVSIHFKETPVHSRACTWNITLPKESFSVASLLISSSRKCLSQIELLRCRTVSPALALSCTAFNHLSKRFWSLGTLKNDTRSSQFSARLFLQVTTQQRLTISHFKSVCFLFIFYIRYWSAINNVYFFIFRGWSCWNSRDGTWSAFAVRLQHLTRVAESFVGAHASRGGSLKSREI